MAKTQTKTEIRNSTAKIGKLLRGIDNDTLAIKKDQEKVSARVKTVQDSVKTVQTLMGGISNAALAAPLASRPNAAQAKKPAQKKLAVAKKQESKSNAKPAVKKPVKKAAAKKAAKKVVAKPAVAKKAAAKKPEKTPPVSNRPLLKQVISDIIAKNGKAMGAADIYKTACQQFGYWSRQSLYNALKDSKTFTKDGDGYKVAGTKSAPSKATSDAEADDFVQRVENNAATSSVV